MADYSTVRHLATLPLGELDCFGVVVTQSLDGNQFRTFDDTVDTHICSIIGLLNLETIFTVTPDFR